MTKQGTKEFEHRAILVDMSFVDEEIPTSTFHLTVVIDDHELDNFSIRVPDSIIKEDFKHLNAVFKGIISSYGYNGFRFVYTKVENLVNT